jgi:integrase
MTNPKKAAARKRNPNGLGSLHQDENGRWHGFVSLGEDENGKRVRRHVSRSTRQETIDRMNELRAEAAGKHEAERAVAAGTVANWLDEWLNEHVASYAKPSTWTNYEGAIRRSIVPVIGSVQLARLTERQVEKVIELVATASGKQMVLKTLKTALAEAWRRRLINENVSLRVKIRRAPSVFSDEEDWDAEPEVQTRKRGAIPPDDLRAVLVEIRRDRLQARWMLGLLGCRRAEVLGLVWEDLDARGVLQLKRNRVRRTYRHGCLNPLLCGKTPGACPNRQPVGQVVKLKTSSSARDLPLGPGALKVLEKHRKTQREEREAFDLPAPKRDWMFTNEDGKPLSHDADYRLWKRLLERAGVDQSYKPHELRHTAASLMGAKDIDDATLMGLMGWSTIRMVNNYRHPFEASMRKALEEFEQDLL